MERRFRVDSREGPRGREGRGVFIRWSVNSHQGAEQRRLALTFGRTDEAATHRLAGGEGAAPNQGDRVHRLRVAVRLAPGLGILCQPGRPPSSQLGGVERGWRLVVKGETSEPTKDTRFLT